MEYDELECSKKDQAQGSNFEYHKLLRAPCEVTLDRMTIVVKSAVVVNWKKRQNQIARLCIRASVSGCGPIKP